MNKISLVLIIVLVCGVAFAPRALGQEPPKTPTASTEAPAEADVEAGEAAAAAGEAAEVEEGERRRNMPSETKIGLSNEEAIRVTWTPWPLDGRDFPELAKLQSGQVLAITASAPPKLWTHTDLMFGELAIKEGNVAENYPGVYGLWLKKTDAGWSLVFNNKPDVWGTMYDAGADAGEVALEYAVTDSTGDKFAAELKKVSDGSGELHLSWGEHHWSAPFTYGG